MKKTTKKAAPAPASPPNEDLGRLMIRWHHEIAQVSGTMSLRMTKRSVKRGEVLDWSEVFVRIAKEMKDWVDGNCPF